MNSVLAMVYTPAMVLCGCVLNLLTIMVFCQQRMRKYCISLSMICLAISDTNVLVLPVFFTWLDEHFFEFYFLNNTVWCQLHAYLDLVFCAHSSWIIILISTERWFAVYKPFKKARIFTNSRVAWTLLVLFLLGTVVFVRIPLSMHLVAADPANRTTVCGIRLKTVYTLFGSLSIVLIYVLPSIILAILNVMIIVRLRIRPFSKSSVQMRRSTGRSLDRQRRDTFRLRQQSVPELASEADVSQPGHQPRNSSNGGHINSKNDRNLSITLVTVAIVFMILTFPYQGYWFYEQFQQFYDQYRPNQTSASQATDAPPNLQKLTLAIKNMNYVINFFMYSALSTLFREEFIALFTRKKKAPSLGNITRLTLNPNMTNALNSRENPSEQQNNASSQNKKACKKPPLAEFEFALLPCLQAPSKRRLVRVRFETSSLRELLQRRREQRDR